MAAGKALSVLGPISPEELGIVLPHEHLLLDFKQAFISRDPDSSKLSFCMENLGTIRQYPYSTIDNLCVDSEDDLIHELQLYKQAGGSTLCDLTVTGIRINPEALPRISAASGVHIILGSGYYVDQFIPDDIKGIDVETIASTIVSEIENGLGTSGVRCGIIGEIGCSWPLTVYERKVLQGAAIAQSKTGAPLIIHPGRDERAPFEIVDILKQAGADISRTVMSHIDRTIMSRDNLLKFAQSGCGIEYDLFGIECSHYQFNRLVDMPSDAQRIQMIKLLIESGYKDRLFVSHDIHTKHRLVKYGGHGYGHLLNDVKPMMLERGMTQDIIDDIMIKNTKKWLTFV